MPKLIEKKEVEGRVLELREFGDVFVVYAWPKERAAGVVRLEELGVFKNVAKARELMSQSSMDGKI